MDFANRRIMAFRNGLTPKRGFVELGSVEGYSLWLSDHPNAWSYAELNELSAGIRYLVWGLGRQNPSWIGRWAPPEDEGEGNGAESLLRYAVVAMPSGSAAPQALIELGALGDRAFYLWDLSTEVGRNGVIKQLDPQCWMWVVEPAAGQEQRREF